MEQMFSFPFSYRRLTISYDSMVRITDWNYTPVSGDSFTYKKPAAIYAGSVAEDFADNNAAFDLLKNYSLSVRMINMFFASTDGGNTGDKNFDCKMTIAPTAQTATGNLSEMRYAFSYFRFNLRRLRVRSENGRGTLFRGNEFLNADRCFGNEFYD